MTLRYAEGFPISGRCADLEADTDRQYTAQKPYKNGIVVYARSIWGGNGFGTDVTRIAVRDGEIVGVYDSGWSHSTAVVLGHGSISSDIGFMGYGKDRRQYTIKTAFSKWIAAVKAL